MPKYELDVVLPFHVLDQYLIEAIESCISALPDQSRLILINTRSDQKEIEVRYDSVLELNLKNADYMSALGFGIGKSDAKYIALMNSDDIVDQTRFTRQLQELKNSKKDLCVTSIEKFAISRAGATVFIPSLLGKAPQRFNEALLLLGSYRADASWCFKSSWAQQNFLFSSDQDISDWCTAMRVMRSTNTVVIDENLYLYRMHPRQITRLSRVHASPHFLASWEALNQKLGFAPLNRFEIEMLLSIEKSNKRINLDNTFAWLTEVEDYLKEKLESSNHKMIENLISRRRLLISIKNRTIRIQDLSRIPVVLFEYIRFRKYLRGSL